MKRINKKKISLILFVFIVVIAIVIIFKVKNCSNELLKNNDFTLIYNQGENTKITKIIDKNTSEYYDYDIYTYGGDVIIEVKEKQYNFKELEEQIISIDKILEKAKKDTENNICQQSMYLDGGTTIYKYENYTILKYNTDFSNKKDVYVGNKNMKLEDIEEQNSALSDDSSWLNN